MTNQQWRGMKAAEAFLVIERHAGSWEDAGQMMEAWVLANRDPIAPGQLVDLPPGFIFQPFAQPYAVTLDELQPFAQPYAVTLDELQLFADAACELDSYKDTLSDKPDERERIVDMIERIHDTVQRVAGADAHFIYAPDDSHLACRALEEGVTL
jgi:hypothetical protein